MKAKANAPVSSSSLTVLWTAALIALSATTPTPGTADQHAATASDTRVADISLADLDLSTPEGLRAARDRLRTMARRLCAELAHSRELSYQPNFAACVDDTLAGALAQVNALAAAKELRTAQRTAP